MTDTWTPEFPGQRPPFEAHNTLAVQHGARSERHVAPLAAEIERNARANPAWPSYLQDASYRPAVAAWARAEAVVELLWQFVGERDLQEAMTDTSVEESTERHGKGGSSRTSSGRRTAAALAMLDRWERTAAGHRKALGLDPLARGRLGRDVTSARLDLVQLLTNERERAEREQAEPTGDPA